MRADCRFATAFEVSIKTLDPSLRWVDDFGADRFSIVVSAEVYTTQISEKASGVQRMPQASIKTLDPGLRRDDNVGGSEISDHRWGWMKMPWKGKGRGKIFP